MSKELTEAQKLDILLSFKKEYNLVDTGDPAVMTMSMGKGYTLFASVNRSWFIEFNDGVEISSYNIESDKVPYTNAKDAIGLYTKYGNKCESVLNGIEQCETEGDNDETPKFTTNPMSQSPIQDEKYVTDELIKLLNSILTGITNKSITRANCMVEPNDMDVEA